MSNKLQEKIKKIISDQLRDYPILVWYDEDGSLQDIMFDAIPTGVNLVPYQGSYLAIRAKIEREDPEFQQKWLIYIPEKPIDPSWIRDYELFGKRIDMTLEKLLVEHFKLESDLELKELLTGERARLLASKWEEVMRDIKIPLQKDQVINGLLSIAFDLGASFSLGRAILEYVTFTKPRQELQRLGLHEVFIKLIKQELGLDLKAKPEDLSEALASALLFSELVFYSKGLGEYKFSNLLPKKDKIETWAKLARDWLEHTSLKQGFINWSKKLAKKYDIKSELHGIENLINVMSFAIVDEVLMEELKARVSLEPDGYKRNLEIIDKIAKARIKSPWATKGKINIWQVVGLASQIYSLCEKAISSLQEKAKDAKFLTNCYIKNEGWWRIDSNYRNLCSFTGVNEDIRRFFLKPSFSSYARWLRIFTEHFSNAVEGLKQWKIEGLLNQFEFWQKTVQKETKPLAILLIDALRYELSKELEKDLSENGYEVKLIPMLSSLPSITEICMASLLPHKSLSAKVEKGKLQVFIDGSTQINQKITRQKFLEDKLGSKALILELDEILKLSLTSLKERIEGYEYVIVMDRDIDIAGTYLLEISPHLFGELVSRLFNAVERLHKAGLRTVIVTTDHGFLLIPEDYRVNMIEGIKAQSDVDKKRRYIIGKPPYNPSLISFKFNQIWLEGDGVVAFPRGLSCLSMPGPAPLFLHGGISPQENCISVIISKAKIELEKIRVKAELPDEITTAVFLVDLIPLAKPGAEKPRIVKVEVYSEGKRIAESDAIKLQKDKKKARLILREIKPEAEIRVIDADTREVLKRKKVKIHIFGYSEEI